MIYVYTLGTARIDVGSCTINPMSPRRFALLFYLAEERGRSIPRSVLQELIFPDQAEKNARHSLRELLYQLRQLGADLDAEQSGIQLPTGSVRVDHDSILNDRPIPSHHIRAACGGFLPGFFPTHSETYTDWFEVYRGRSISALSRSLLNEIDRARNSGDWVRTEGAARACLALDPLNEQATIALAEMLFLAGGKVEATQLLDHFVEEVGKVHSDLGDHVRLLRRRIRQAPEIASARLASRFVGRGEEMDALRTALRAALTGEPRCVVLYGEPGIGKTRLASEFRSIIELEGVRCESVAMHPHDANRPLGAFVDVVPALLRLPGALGCAPKSMDALRRLTGGAPGVVAEERDQTDLDAISFAVTAAIVDICESIASENPLALIVEDAHSLDSYSVAMLSELLARQRDARILIILTTREPRRLRGAIRRLERVSWVPLRPLSTEAMTSLIDDIVTPPPSADERARLVEAANGNPLFALSLVSHYRHSPDCGAVPASLAELLSQRLDPASNIALSVLATCIALGKHCTSDRLLRAIEITPIALLDALAELAELGLLDANSDHARAVHPLIAEVVGRRLLPAMQSVVNFRVASVFEHDARALGSPAYWWDAGNRWRDAGEPERALTAFRECARHAIDIGRAADAARILNNALQLSTSDQSTLQAARELIRAADISSDTGLVLRGYAILKNAGLPDHHDEFELAARRAVIRDSQLPEQIFEMTLRCLAANSATPEHRVLAATIGLKGIHVAQSNDRITQIIAEQVSRSDLDVVENVVRLEFELLLGAARCDWVNAADIAGELMRAAEGKRHSRRVTLQQNCGIVLGLAGRPYEAIDAWQRAFFAAGVVQSPSQQVRLASLVAGLYNDLCDDENRDAWISRAVEASNEASFFMENFDLPLILICRSFAREDAADVHELLDRAREEGLFSGSPVRERWGKVFSMQAEAENGPPSAALEAAARELVTAKVIGVSGVRDFEIATAATILGARNRETAQDVITTYLATQRNGKQLIDRQLVDTIRRLALSDPIIERAMPPLLAQTRSCSQSESF